MRVLWWRTDLLEGPPRTWDDVEAAPGAFGFTGRAIAERLLEAGHDVVTLTRRSGAGDRMTQRLTVRPFDASRPGELEASLRGVDVLFNTYWLRFPRGAETFEGAVASSATLLAAARGAGVRRVVHVSVVSKITRRKVKKCCLLTDMAIGRHRIARFYLGCFEKFLERRRRLKFVVLLYQTREGDVSS